MEDGDVYITNDPWLGTGHLNDFTVVTPTFDGRPVGLFACTDPCGSMSAAPASVPTGAKSTRKGSTSRSCRSLARARSNDSVFRVVRANVRDPIEVEGDIYSLMACNGVGGNRLIGHDAGVRADRSTRSARWIVETPRACRMPRRSAPCFEPGATMTIDDVRGD